MANPVEAVGSGRNISHVIFDMDGLLLGNVVQHLIRIFFHPIHTLVFHGDLRLKVQIHGDDYRLEERKRCAFLLMKRNSNETEINSILLC